MKISQMIITLEAIRKYRGDCEFKIFNYLDCKDDDLDYDFYAFKIPNPTNAFTMFGFSKKKEQLASNEENNG